MASSTKIKVALLVQTKTCNQFSFFSIISTILTILLQYYTPLRLLAFSFWRLLSENFGIFLLYIQPKMMEISFDYNIKLSFTNEVSKQNGNKSGRLQSFKLEDKTNGLLPVPFSYINIWKVFAYILFIIWV